MQVVTLKTPAILLEDLMKEFDGGKNLPHLTVLAVNYGCIYRLTQAPEGGDFFFSLMVDMGESNGHPVRHLCASFSKHLLEASFHYIMRDLGSELHVFRKEREAASFIASFIGNNSCKS